MLQDICDITSCRTVEDHAEATLLVQRLDGLGEFLVHLVVGLLNVRIEVDAGVVEAHVGHERQELWTGTLDLAVSQNFGHVALGKVAVFRRHEAAYNVAASGILCCRGVGGVGCGGGDR